ncbi:hypothetical protein HMPREF6123_2472 [Oribacterium sinus F0268]|uniref:Uncharacterized protein n=1 Tax=Oribacterium sinus F0268 TaxID=585501 RepID=C2L153_9FIRM|nr:hypothetical protein HMPREF6123_2472 [Oribacterium sinus F0268]
MIFTKFAFEKNFFLIFFQEKGCFLMRRNIPLPYPASLRFA